MNISSPQWKKIYDKMLDHSVSEVQVNGIDQVFIKQRGKRIHLSEIYWDTEEEYAESIPSSVVPLVQSMNYYDPNGSIYEGKMTFSGRFNDKPVDVQARCHVMLPPVCDVPQVTLAKRSKTLTTLDSLASMGSMSSEMMQFIEMAVESNLTVVFSGQTGSGKDLHQDTLIPTINGFKKIGDIEIGDTIFNEEGKPVEVTNKYKPEKDKKYKISFSNGEEVLAGEGHVWRVLDLETTAMENSSYNVYIPLNWNNISKLEVLTYQEDQYLTIDEFIEFIEYKPINSKNNNSKDIKDPIIKLLENIAIDAGNLYAMTTRSLIDRNKSTFTQTDEYAEIEKSLRSWEREEISFNEFLTLCNNDMKVFTTLTLNNNIIGKSFINKREAANLLINEYNKRIAARITKNEQNHESINYSVRNLTTKQIFKEMESRPVKIQNNNGEEEFVNFPSDSLFAIEKMSGPAVLESKELIIPSYVYGLWLGSKNGSDGRIVVTGKKHKIQEIKARLTTVCGIKDTYITIIDKNNLDEDGDTVSSLKIKNFKSLLKKVYKDKKGDFTKEIVDDYLFSSIYDREELIAGIIDGGGTVSKDGRGNCEFVSTSKTLIEQIRSLVSSLALRTSPIRDEERTINKNGETITLDPAYKIEFFFNRNHFGVNEHIEAMHTRISNIETLGTQDEHSKIYINHIEEYNPEGDESFYCLEVDTPSHLFVFGETFIPTHNTTMLEAVTKLIPDDIRIGVAEDAPELNLIQENVTYLHSVPWAPGMDENEVATLQWVVSQFQRNRCDKLIIGETRGKEFGDFLIAANSGMEGSMTTIHANNPAQCLTKMSNFAMKASEKQPIRAINLDIATAIDIIVQLVVVDGKHRVSHISEIIPTLGNTEEARITQSPLYVWNRIDDTFEKVGNMSDNLRRILDERNADYDYLIRTPVNEKHKHHNFGKNKEAQNFGKKARNDVHSFNEDRASRTRSIGIDDSTSRIEDDDNMAIIKRGIPNIKRGLPKRR